MTNTHKEKTELIRAGETVINEMSLPKGAIVTCGSWYIGESSKRKGPLTDVELAEQKLTYSEIETLYFPEADKLHCHMTNTGTEDLLVTLKAVYHVPAKQKG
jgi:hypothetical protein